MKRLLFVCFMLFYGASLFGQSIGTPTPPPPTTGKVAPVQDTVHSKKVKRSAKVKVVDGTVMTSANDIIDNINLSKDLSVFAEAIKTAGLTETFKSDGPITFFIPENTAFTKLTANKRDSLLKPRDSYDLITLVTYHAIAGKYSIKDLEKKIRQGKGQAGLITLAGAKLIARMADNNSITLTDETGGKCIITKFNVPQHNGMLHRIDNVLVPKAKI